MGIGFDFDLAKETHVNFVRKGLPVNESARIISRYLAFRIVENSRMLFIRALEIQQKYKLSFWDASIVAAAQRSQARELWTEDLNGGQEFDGVIVRDPLK